MKAQEKYAFEWTDMFTKIFVGNQHTMFALQKQHTSYGAAEESIQDQKLMLCFLQNVHNVKHSEKVC